MADCIKPRSPDHGARLFDGQSHQVNKSRPWPEPTPYYSGRNEAILVGILVPNCFPFFVTSPISTGPNIFAWKFRVAVTTMICRLAWFHVLCCVLSCSIIPPTSIPTNPPSPVHVIYSTNTWSMDTPEVSKSCKYIWGRCMCIICMWGQC